LRREKYERHDGVKRRVAETTVISIHKEEAIPGAAFVCVVSDLYLFADREREWCGRRLRAPRTVHRRPDHHVGLLQAAVAQQAAGGALSDAGLVALLHIHALGCWHSGERDRNLLALNE